MSGRQIIVDIIGDSTGFNKATASATQGSQKFGNVLQGIGQGIGQAAFGLVENAVSKVTDAIGESVKRALDYEVASTKLDAALKSNVAGWDGNRDSINGYLDKQTALGFTVTETTNSLAQLVAATGNVAKAQEFQAAAMNLARLKGISLAEATDALTKIEGGSYRILKSLGIQMEKGATQAEVLGAVMKVAGGQASAFMDTAVGKMDEANAKIDDMQVKVGSKLLPVIGKLADGLSAAFDILNGDDIANALVKQTDDFIKLGLSSGDYARALQGVEAQYNSLNVTDMVSAQQKADLQIIIEKLKLAVVGADAAALHTGAFAGIWRDDVHPALAEATVGLDKWGQSATVASSATDKLAGATILLDRATMTAFSDVQTLADAIYGPATSLTAGVDHAKDHVIDLQTQLKTLQEKKDKTPADKRAIGELLADLETAKAGLLVAEARKLQLTGGKVPKDLNQYLQTGEQHLSSMSHEAYLAWKYLHDLAGLGDYKYEVTFKNDTPHHAAGGFAPYGQVAVFGEHGPEVAIPTTGGMDILTAQKSKALFGGGGGGGGTNIVVNINGGLIDGPTIDTLTRALTMRMRYAPGV